MKNNLFSGEVPLGLGMALAQNGKALDRFSSLSETQRSQVIAGTHSIKSPEEMRSYVDSLANGGVI